MEKCEKSIQYSCDTVQKFYFFVIYYEYSCHIVQKIYFFIIDYELGHFLSLGHFLLLMSMSCYLKIVPLLTPLSYFVEMNLYVFGEFYISFAG